jgi:hypothetical protein
MTCRGNHLSIRNGYSILVHYLLIDTTIMTTTIMVYFFMSFSNLKSQEHKQTWHTIVCKLGFQGKLYGGSLASYMSGNGCNFVKEAGWRCFHTRLQADYRFIFSSSNFLSYCNYSLPIFWYIYQKFLQFFSFQSHSLLQWRKTFQLFSIAVAFNSY